MELIGFLPILVKFLELVPKNIQDSSRKSENKFVDVSSAAAKNLDVGFWHGGYTDVIERLTVASELTRE